MAEGKSVGADGKDHLTDKIAQADALLKEVGKYRTALAVIRDTYNHLAALDETDIEQLRSFVLWLYQELDLSIIEDFIE